MIISFCFNSFPIANDFELVADDFTISLKFRTYKRDGPLLYAFSNDRGFTGLSQYGTMMLLELVKGEVNKQKFISIFLFVIKTKQIKKKKFRIIFRNGRKKFFFFFGQKL